MFFEPQFRDPSHPVQRVSLHALTNPELTLFGRLSGKTKTRKQSTCYRYNYPGDCLQLWTSCVKVQSEHGLLSNRLGNELATYMYVSMALLDNHKLHVPKYLLRVGRDFRKELLLVWTF